MKLFNNFLNPTQVLFFLISISCSTHCLFGINITLSDELTEEIDAIEAKEKEEYERISDSEANRSSDSEGSDIAAFDLLPPVTGPEAITDFAENQSGLITGQVFDKESGESLQGVVIIVDGTDLATITDFQGSYSFDDIEVGSYELNFIKDGFIETKVTDTNIVAGEVLQLNLALPRRPVEMSDDVYQLQDFVVTAQEVISQNVALISLRKSSIGAIEALSSEDFKKYASSSMADAMTRISGASISDGKYAVIRGLDDRYNTVLLNGVLLPSPDPDRKAVALDVFPTKLFTNLVVNKSFTADLPGDSSGGALTMNTKGIPDKAFFNVSMGVEHSTLNDNLNKDYYLADAERVSYRDWLFGNDPRGFSIPEVGNKLISNYSNTLGIIDYPLFASELRKFPKLNGKSFSFSFGNSRYLRPDLKVGMLFAQNFSSKYKSKFTEVEKISINPDGFFQVSEIGNIDNRGGVTEGVEEYKYSTLFSLGTEIGDHSKLGYTFIDIKDFESSSSEYDYRKMDDRGESLISGDPLIRGLQNVRDMNSSAIQKDFTLQMLNGNHTLGTLFGGSELEWNIARVDTEQREADIRNIFDYFYDYGSFLNIASLPSVSRFERETTQNTDIFNIKLSNSLEIFNNLTFSFDLGTTGSKSDRSFKQLETRLTSYSHITGEPNYVALPAPDGIKEKLPFIITNEQGEQEEILKDKFYHENPLETQSFVENLFNERESTIEDRNNSLNTNVLALEERKNTLNDQIENNKQSVNSQLNGWNGYASFSGLEVAIDPNDLLVYNTSQSNLAGISVEDYLDQLNDEGHSSYGTLNAIYAGFAGSIEAIEDDQTEIIEIDADISQINLDLVQSSEDLNLLNQERAQMRQFYTDIAALDSFVDLPNYHFNYTIGDGNSGRTSPQHILNTPLGYAFYTSSDGSTLTDSQYSAKADYLYEAKGISETNSVFLNNSVKFNQFLGNKILTVSSGIRLEESKLSYKILDKRPDVPGFTQPAPTSAVIVGFAPAVIDNRPIDQSDEFYYLTASIEPEDGQFKLFFSSSLTAAKPTFREIAPFPIFNITDKSVELGNSGLMITDASLIDDPNVSQYYLLSEQFAGLRFAEVKSTDLRFDYYIGDDGLISLGFFNKIVENPIERVLARSIGGIDINTYLNNDNDAEIDGIEFEFKQSFGDLSLGGNFSKIDAEVERSKYEKDSIAETLSTLQSDLETNSTNSLIDIDTFINGEASKRSLYNQPNYMGNFFVSYYFEKLRLTCSFSKNWVGEQLYRAGSVTSDGGAPDLFWDSYDSSNLVFDYQVNDSWNIKLTVKDLDSSPRNLIYGENFVSQFTDQRVFYDNLREASPYEPETLGNISSFNRKSYSPEPSFSLSISGKF